MTRPAAQRLLDVSIPQSEFCPLGRPDLTPHLRNFLAFQFLSRNSVRWDVEAYIKDRVEDWAFQFLSRNSVRWDRIVRMIEFEEHRFQFLSRNSVRWDGKTSFLNRDSRIVSIPQSEFCPLGPVVLVRTSPGT